MQFNGGEKMQKRSLFGLACFLCVCLIIAVVAQSYGLLPNFNKGGLSGVSAVEYPINVGATPQEFTPWELETWLGIKDRLTVNNTTPDFPDPEHRVLGWYSLRNSSSNDYYQKSMEFLLFWEGRGVDGEWEAVCCIYNVPNSTSEFVVEFSKFTWGSMEIRLDGVVMAEFPQVEADDMPSLAYVTFRVYP